MKTILTSYSVDSKAIRIVRFNVFVEEQGVPAENEMDERDEVCIHALSFNKKGNPIATGRLDHGQGGKIGRVAVLAEYRGKGLGRQIMDQLEQAARMKGLEQVKLNAQTSALDFYRKLGYQEEGEEFMEENIPHLIMRKRL